MTVDKLKIKQRIRVRLRQLPLISNVSKELVWLGVSEDPLRDELKLSGLSWYDMGSFEDNELTQHSSIPKFFIPPNRVKQEVPGSDIENAKLFIKGKLEEIPLTSNMEDQLDLTMAREYVPCFGSQYRACTLRKECKLAGLCKQESSRLRAQDKLGTTETYVQIRDNAVEGTSQLKRDMTLENATDETIKRWKQSDRMLYYRYLKHMVFNEEEKLALEAATLYEEKVKKLGGMPFYVVLGKSGDITQHKNWGAFLRVGKRAIEHKASIKQYMEAQFHYSHSKTGYPPTNGLGSANAGKRYDDYVQEVVKKGGTKMVKVWRSNDPFYSLEESLDTMWSYLKENHSRVFPSKEFYLFHGMKSGFGRTEHFTEGYLRKKYDSKLYNRIEGRYEEVLESMSQLPKVYIKDMNTPSHFTDIYSN